MLELEETLEHRESALEGPSLHRILGLQGTLELRMPNLETGKDPGM